MTDPKRWSRLNDSERAMLRAARVARDAEAALTKAQQECSISGNWKALPAELYDADNDGCIGIHDAFAALTDTDPPEKPIALPDGWNVADGPKRYCAKRETVGLYIGGNADFDIDECSAGIIPLAILALLLREAGWKVEEP